MSVKELASFGFRQPSCRMYSDEVGMISPGFIETSGATGMQKAFASSENSNLSRMVTGAIDGDC